MGMNNGGLVYDHRGSDEACEDILERLLGKSFRTFAPDAPRLSVAMQARLAAITDARQLAGETEWMQRFGRHADDVSICDTAQARFIFSSHLAHDIVNEPPGLMRILVAPLTRDQRAKPHFRRLIGWRVARLASRLGAKVPPFAMRPPPARAKGPDGHQISAALGHPACLMFWIHFDFSNSNGCALFEAGRKVRRFVNMSADGYQSGDGRALPEEAEWVDARPFSDEERRKFAADIEIESDQGPYLMRNRETQEILGNWNVTPRIVCAIMEERFGWSPALSDDYGYRRLPEPPHVWTQYRAM